MALTFTLLNKDRLGRGQLCNTYEVTFDNSYPTGGEAVTAANFGLTTVRFLDVSASTNIAAKFANWDRTNAKIILRSGTAELANASDQSLVKVLVIAIGV